MKLLGIYRMLYLLGAVNALFFCFLIISKKRKALADKILASWLVILFVQLIIPFFYLSDLDVYYKYAGLEISFFVFHPVLLYFYVKSMIGQFPKLKSIFCAFLAIIVSEIAGLSFFLFPAEERFNFIKGKALLPAVYYPFVVFMIFYFFYYTYNSYKALKIYKDTVLQIYSYRENVDLLWLRRLVLFFSSLIIIVFPVGLISYFNFYSVVFADYFFYAGLVIFVFLLGFWGYQQGEIFSFKNTADLLNEKVDNKPSVIQEDMQKEYKQKAVKLKQLMTTTKPYLDPKLAIHDLAKSIEVNPHLLSKIIKKEFHSSFYEFVNSYRIEEFKQKAFSKEFRNLTILAIALECGFNSKSAFNRIFKESTGITPGDFIKHHRP